MQDYQYEFIEFALDINVLRFGEFTLKSGRISPYFFNSGLFNTGSSLSRLGKYYAEAIVHSGIEYDMVYGPAYKGIPLVATMSIALAENHHRDVPYAFNRKEAKSHGEGGIIVGSELEGKVLIVDDVISAGTSVRESVDIINQQGAKTAGVLIALDRQEVGQKNTSAIQEVEQMYGLRVASIIKLENLIEYLKTKSHMSGHLETIQEYREKYGVK